MSASDLIRAGLRNDSDVSSFLLLHTAEFLGWRLAMLEGTVGDLLRALR